jgi:predicted acyltransferase
MMGELFGWIVIHYFTFDWNHTMNAEATPIAPKRLASLDTYRGFVMFLMVAECLHLSRISELLPDSGFWRFLAHHQSHVEWVGCSLHDLIQPSFSFMVGVALPFSIASRMARGHNVTFLSLHALWRAFLLVMLGVFLRSMDSPQTYFTFEDTLSQIGLGYFFLFSLGFRPVRDQFIALGAILVGYWLAFALYPLPAPGFDTAAVGVPPDWPNQLTGFAAHWNKNTNFASWFDQWFLNLFPREHPFVYNGGGYLTLSFIPTLGTMILGLIAGGVLRGDRAPMKKVLWLAIAGVIGLASGLILHYLGICPYVKRIWTPSWTLFSGGWCFLILAGLYLVIDVWEFKAWAFPLVVIGMNSIGIYCMAHVMEGFILDSFRIHLGENFFLMFGDAYKTLVSGTCVIVTFWLILYWMYKRKLFLKI